MSGQHVSKEQVTLKRVCVGPLNPYINTFASLLSEQGYAKFTIENKISLLADFSRWLHQKNKGVLEANEQAIDTFMEYHMGQGRHAFRGNRYTLQMLIQYLRDNGIIPIPTSATDDNALNQIMCGFTHYLLKERGLSKATVTNYLLEAKRFLSDRFGTGIINLNKLHSSDIIKFVLRYVRKLSHSRIKLMGTALRSFLCYLRLCGEITTDLAAAVPTPAEWKFSKLPKFLEPGQVESLLNSCDQSTTIGQRDYTVLLLLSRLGMRAGEVVAMTLDDINWEAGKFIVRGKGSRQEQLPIPYDIGEALAKYLRYGRPRCSTRRVFIRIKAPHHGFSSSVAICNIVRRALSRSGLKPVHKGAHLLRHSLATHMLREGATLAEIGELLRHSLPSTTEIYSKVDKTSLRELAQPWPGGEI